jgi:dTDP-4-dehydrorhamnose reductase
LYEWCRSHSAFLIHFSNDEVFEGRDIPYDESSLPDARSIYGRAKALGEIDDSQCLTIRSSFLGPELENSTEFFSRLNQNPTQKVAASKSHFYCGVSTVYLAKLVADLIRHGLPLSGLFQVASQPISEFDLLHLLNRQFQWNLQIQEVPGSTVPHKILSNQKLLRHWPSPPPRWSDMVFELHRTLEQHGTYQKAAA